MKVSPFTVYTGVAVAASMALAVAGCGRSAEALTPQQLQQQYGITGAYTGQVATPDGAMGGTIVPVTLPAGRSAQLIIPAAAGTQPHAMYLQDAQGFHPVAVQPGVQRSQLTSAPLSVSS